MIYLTQLPPAAAAAAAPPETGISRVGTYVPEVPGTEGPRMTLERLIEASLHKDGNTDAGSLQSTLAAMPPGFMKRYALMFRTRSLQKASFAAPRAIVFEDDGSFALAFNGGGRVRGGDKIEAVQFRADQKRWEFREIAFVPGRAPEVSEANPRRCLECHQSSARSDIDPRPNWEPYNLWPGAYGGNDGIIGRHAESNFGDGPSAAIMREQQGQEASRLASFFTTVKDKHPRYKWLGDFYPRATLELTDVFVDRNSERVARLARASPDWDVYGALFMDSLLCHGPYYSDHARLPPTTPDDLRAAHDAAFTALQASQPAYLFNRNGSGRMEYFFDTRAIDTTDWSMDFRTGGRYAFQDRFGSPSYPFQQMQRGFIGDISLEQGCADAQAAYLAVAPGLRSTGRFSAVINRLSRTLPEPMEIVAGQLKNCMSCHSQTSTSTAPWIPFDQPTALQAELKKQGYSHGTLLQEIAYRLDDYAESEQQMPPTGLPPLGVREKLMEHLNGLAGG